GFPATVVSAMKCKRNHLISLKNFLVPSASRSEVVPSFHALSLYDGSAIDESSPSVNFQSVSTGFGKLSILSHFRSSSCGFLTCEKTASEQSKKIITPIFFMLSYSKVSQKYKSAKKKDVSIKIMRQRHCSCCNFA